jgi:AcrR family transcriptional regulator
LEAALEAFAVTGYHGTTTRDIAARAGMSPAAVYIRFESKADLLAEISVAGHSDVLAEVVAAVAKFEDPVVRLDGIIRAFVNWHVTNSKIARVIEYELHALEPEAYERVAEIRREMSRLFRALVRDALDSKGLETADLGLVTRAIISMGVDVARWHTPGSQPTPAHLARLYADLAFKMLGLSGLPKEPAGVSGPS